MITCKTCGRQISGNATVCPHCGETNSFWEKLALFAIFWALLMGLAALLESPKTRKPTLIVLGVLVLFGLFVEFKEDRDKYQKERAHCERMGWVWNDEVEKLEGKCQAKEEYKKYVECKQAGRFWVVRKYDGGFGECLTKAEHDYAEKNDEL